MYFRLCPHFALFIHFGRKCQTPHAIFNGTTIQHIQYIVTICTYVLFPHVRCHCQVLFIFLFFCNLVESTILNVYETNRYCCT